MMMVVSVPCNEKFIRQYYQNLPDSNILLNSLDLLLEMEFEGLRELLSCYIEKDDEVCNLFLLSSFFSFEEESEDEFMERYEEAIYITAYRGNPISQFAVAEDFEDDGDNYNAFKFHWLSSEKCFAPSLTNTGIKLIYGSGCTKDVETGLSFVKKANQLGDEIANEFLDYWNTTNGVNQPTKK